MYFKQYPFNNIFKHIKAFLYNVVSKDIIKETFSRCKRILGLCLLNCI